MNACICDGYAQYEKAMPATAALGFNWSTVSGVSDPGCQTQAGSKTFCSTECLVAWGAVVLAKRMEARAVSQGIRP